MKRSALRGLPSLWQRPNLLLWIAVMDRLKGEEGEEQAEGLDEGVKRPAEKRD